MSRWVLLRGLTREAGHWAAFGAELAARSGSPVSLIDLPGNGSRWRARSPAGVDAMAAQLCGELRGLGEPVRLVAMSLGAMVALECCRQMPEAVAACVLINTSAAGLSPFWRRLRPAQYPVLVRLLLPGLTPLEREERVLGMTSACPQRHPGAARDWAALATRHPVSPANAVRQLRAAAAYRPPASPPPVPLLLLASEGDRLVHPSCSRRLAAHWQAPLRLHPWAGHDLPLDDPDWVLRQLLEWPHGPG